MQEIHSMGGTRFFGGGGAAGGGDRRLRPHHHHHHHHSHVQNNNNNNNNNHHQQALKCPRCDSLNTKFCYYNNYNLSQPRHFCKNCRRYWTKGGVLRNVPVGGGCRKSKRSNKTKNTSNATTASSSETTTSSQQHQHQPPPDQQKSNSHSSSESSSLTAATTAAAVAVTELNSESSNNNLYESSNLLIPSSNPGLESGTGGDALEQGAGGDCGGIFSEIGTFTSLIASSSSNNDAMAFGFGGGVADAASFQWQHQKLPEGLSGSGGSALLDHGHGAVTVDFSTMQGKTGNGGFGPLDWQGGADQGLFDLPNAVDQAYWSHTQWPDQDNSALFHLP